MEYNGQKGLKIMKQSERPLWKKSILQTLNLYDIKSYLYEISENGDPYGYENGESGYYLDYKEQFDELSAGACAMLEALDDYGPETYGLEDNWNDMAVALLGYKEAVLGYDAAEMDYFHMVNPYCEDWAVEEATKRIKRLTKDDMVRLFRSVLSTFVLFFDIKASHDCLTSIVEELDNRGAILSVKNDEINHLYEDLTGKNGEDFDRLIERLPQRMWIE